MVGAGCGGVAADIDFPVSETTEVGAAGIGAAECRASIERAAALLVTGIFHKRSPLRLFPRELVATKVTVACCLAVDRFQEIKLFHQYNSLLSAYRTKLRT